MPFCENCGEKINAGDLFCESCGSPVEKDSAILQGDATKDVLSQMNMSLLNSADWQKQWAHINSSLKGHETGIILTRENLLIESLNGGCTDRLHEILSQYITFVSKKRRIDYFYLDISSPVWSSKKISGINDVLEILHEIIKVAMPQYLFILGNQEIIDVAEWGNNAMSPLGFLGLGDADKTVWGDFAYTILNTVSPWEIKKYDEKNMLRVGRLPNYDGESMDSFGAYFHELQSQQCHFSQISPYSLSADAWKDASMCIVKSIASSEINLSPPCNLKNLGKHWEDSNLLYFNLHGGDGTDTPQWFGQHEDEYPEAMSPNIINRKKGSFFLGVEACYGAKYGKNITPDNSILLASMRNGCHSFLGSSKIAYGSCTSNLCDADNMIGEYIHQLYLGKCAGDAYLAGLTKVWNQKVDSPSKGKTIAEFSLYGDPSVRMIPTENSKSICNGFLKQMQFKHFIGQPDIRGPVTIARCEIDRKIQILMDECLQRTCFPSKTIEEIRKGNMASFRTNSTTPLFCQQYSFPSPIASFFEVYSDSFGKILQISSSK